MNKKVRDHCHYTRKYKGAAHQMHNLQYMIPYHISIIFHNLCGYDVHLFIREFGKKFDSGFIGIIAENEEKYISFTVTMDKYEMPADETKQIMRQL